jgi:hypothetical protein
MNDPVVLLTLGLFLLCVAILTLILCYHALDLWDVPTQFAHAIVLKKEKEKDSYLVSHMVVKETERFLTIQIHGISHCIEVRKKIYKAVAVGQTIQVSYRVGRISHKLRLIHPFSVAC